MRFMLAVLLAIASSSALAEPHSSLPWVSGVSYPGGEFGAWRGQRVDVQVGWLDEFKGSWEELARSAEEKDFGGEWRDAMVSLGVPLLTEATRGQFRQCAAGAFDSYAERIGRALAEELGRPIVLRLAWEANGTHYPWYGVDNPEGFKACFRRHAGIYRTTMPGSLIELAHGKGKMESALKLWPGDDAVDIVGAHFYDRFPSVGSEREWQEFVASDRGPDAWLRFARERGKMLAVAEWGVSNGKDGGTDNPLFIEKMHGWFQGAAGKGLFYEAYFNRTANKYRIHPQPSNPKAALAYRRLWGGGGAIPAAAR